MKYTLLCVCKGSIYELSAIVAFIVGIATVTDDCNQTENTEKPYRDIFEILIQ